MSKQKNKNKRKDQLLVQLDKLTDVYRKLNITRPHISEEQYHSERAMLLALRKKILRVISNNSANNVDLLRIFDCVGDALSSLDNYYIRYTRHH